MFRLFQNPAMADPNEKIGRKFKNGFVFLFVTNILIIQFGSINSSEPAQLANTTVRIHKANPSFDCDEQVSLFSRHTDDIAKMIMNNYNSTQVAVTRCCQNVENLEKANKRLENEVKKIKEKLDHQNENPGSKIANNSSQVEGKILEILARHTSATDAVRKNLESEMEKIRQQLEQTQATSSQLVAKLSALDARVLDIMQRAVATELANKALENKFAAVFNTPASAPEKTPPRYEQSCEFHYPQRTKNISDTKEQVLVIEGEINELRKTNKALEKKIIGPSNRRTDNNAIIKYSEHQLKINAGRSDNSLFEGPTFYTSSYGYRMRVDYNITEESAWVYVRVLQGEYDGLLKWPFSGTLTFTIFDQSEHANDFVLSFEVPKGVQLWCPIDRWQRPKTSENKKCLFTFGVLKPAPNRQYIKDNSMFVGVKVEEKSTT